MLDPPKSIDLRKTTTLGGVTKERSKLMRRVVVFGIEFAKLEIEIAWLLDEEVHASHIQSGVGPGFSMHCALLGIDSIGVGFSTNYRCVSRFGIESIETDGKVGRGDIGLGEVDGLGCLRLGIVPKVDVLSIESSNCRHSDGVVVEIEDGLELKRRVEKNLTIRLVGFLRGSSPVNPILYTLNRRRIHEPLRIRYTFSRNGHRTKEHFEALRFRTDQPCLR